MTRQTDPEREFLCYSLMYLFRISIPFTTARVLKIMKIKINKPSIDEISNLLKFADELPDHEPDPEMLEIEEAKKRFEDQSNLEAFWAGRILADRKSARIAA
jgi:hypothetical protein